MATKLYDLIVPISKYTDQNGQEKRRWENIGAIWQDTDNNGNTYKFAMLKRTFNPAGVETREGSDAIRVTMTPPKAKQQQQQQQQTQQAQPSQQHGYSQWEQPDFGNPAPDGFGASVNDMPF